MARKKVAVDAARASYCPSDIIELKIKKLKERMVRAPVELNDWEIKQAYYKGPGEYEFLDSEFRKFDIGETWGGDDEITAFLRCKTTIPQQYDGEPLYLDMYINGYSLMQMNGRPMQGLDFYRQIVLLTSAAKGGEECLFEIEASVKHLPYENWYNDIGNVRVFSKSRFIQIDKEIEGLYYDLDVALKASKVFNDRPELQDFVFDRAFKAAEMLDFYEKDFEVFRNQVIAARAYLKTDLFDNPRYQPVGDIKIVGQSHLDLVYLWPYKETIRKNARTTASTLRLMDEYPEFSFLQSQPKLYEDLEHYFPQLFSEVEQRQKEGRWEATGGLYVEPDCNLPSGESYVRQILHGKRYFREKFGFDTTVCWLPDVFGITWSLPQILRKAGLKFTSSIKLTTWNDTNEFPHHTFWWKGLDGSRLLVHFPTSHFNWGMEPKVIDDHWRKYNQKEANGESMAMGGLGDGGSGMTREFLENIRRMENFPGLPSCKFETAESWFNRQWEKHADKEGSLPEWYDELYMEGHRGTFTTAALIKKLNRECEFLYRDAEMFSVFAGQLGHAYDRERLTEGWRLVLLHQFHDTLPGTHPQEAFVWATEELQKAKALGEEIRTSALEHIAEQVKTEADSLVVFNSLPWVRTGNVRATVKRVGENFKLIAPDGSETAYTKESTDGDTHVIVFTGVDLPAMGYATYALEEGASAHVESNEMSVSPEVMENRFFRLRIGANGNLTSIYDKLNEREVLAEGAEGNRFQLFEDIPGPFSAWDIIPEYKDNELGLPDADSIKVVEESPVRIVVETSREFEGADPGEVVLNSEGHLKPVAIERKDTSKIVQRIVLYADVPRIDFETKIRWHETEKLLKVAFPVSVFSKTATYDIAFGNIERATHYNTSWDEAKFEVCGHKWADLSEGNYGVSVLNDCKYGWDIYENNMRLTLLKAPTRPSIEMDRGDHEFTYSLYPHAGTWRQADTFRQAYQLNAPVVAVQQTAHEGDLPATHSFMSVDADNVFVEAVKRAEDSDDIIIRVCEHFRQRGNATLRLDRNIQSAGECNLLEEDEGTLDSRDGAISFDLTPYELKTFKLKL